MLSKNSVDTWVDNEKLTLPTLEQINALKVGMCIDGIIKIVGKFQGVKMGHYSSINCVLEVEDNKEILLTFGYDQVIDSEYCKFDPNNVKTHYYIYLMEIVK